MKFYPWFVDEKEKKRQKELDMRAEEYGRQMEEEKIPLKNKLAMILSAYLVLVLPTILILIALCAFMMWIIGVI